MASAREREVAALTALAAGLAEHDLALAELGDALRQAEDRRAALMGLQTIRA